MVIGKMVFSTELLIGPVGQALRYASWRKRNECSAMFLWGARTPRYYDCEREADMSELSKATHQDEM